MNAPDNWLEICAEELQRGKLASHPQKFKFAEERGMKDLDEVHAWMVTTRRNFIEMVEKAMRSNVPHEGADAASSRTLPLDVVVGPREKT